MCWGVVYYRTKDGRMPAEEFLDGLRPKVAARFDSPQIAVINGLSKNSGERFGDGEYTRGVRDLGDDYVASFPRRDFEMGAASFEPATSRV